MLLADFHFLRPLWFLSLLPLAFLLWRLWRARAHRSGWQAVCDPELLDALLTTPGGGRSRSPLALLAAGWLLAVTALAGPTWSELPQPVFRSEQSRVLVLDLSQSMDATDLTPSRIAQARFRLLDLLAAYEEGQTGLIAFAGQPFVVSPLTDDSATIAALVPSLDTSLMPQGGSRTDLALTRAGELLRQAGVARGEIILIGDEVHPLQASLEAARELRTDGHRVSVLALGTAEGAPIPQAAGGFVTDADGAIVLPGLDAATLERLAANGGGLMVAGNRGDALDRLLSVSTEALVSDEAESGMQADRWREQGPWLVLALLPLAALAFRRGWLGAALLGVALGLQWLPADPLHAAEARFDREQVRMDETLHLTLAAPGSYQGEPDLSAVEQDFEILGTSRSARISIINGNKSARTEWHLTLSPRREGTLRIAPFEVGGELTPALSIESVPPGSGAERELMVEFSAEPADPYVQAETRLTLRIFHATALQDGRVSEPEVGDAPIVHLGKDSAYRAERDGRQYRVIERRYALFPQHSGELVIPAITFSGQVRVASPRRLSNRLPFGGMLDQTRGVRLRSQPITLQVRPRADGRSDGPWLPARRVGLNETWSPDPPVFRVGEPVTRTLTLSAEGLTAAQLPDLNLPAGNGLRVYADQPASEEQSEAGGVGAQRVFKAALVPERAGALTLPAIELRWWDTSDDGERELVLPARTVQVLPASGAGVAGPPTASEPPAVATRDPAPTPAATPAATPAVTLAPTPMVTRAQPWLAPPRFDRLDIALTALWLLTLTLWLYERRRGRRSAPARAKPIPSPTPSRAATELRRSCRANDAAASRDALLDWGRAAYASTAVNSLGQLAALLPEPAGAAVRQLDQALYRGNGAWDARACLDALNSVLDAPPPAQQHRAAAAGGLPSLYPQT